MSSSDRLEAMRIRREPPRFRTLEVRAIEPITAWMLRVTLTGPDLVGFAVDDPAASVRLLLPSPGSALVLPEWNGNEFLLADGSRPILRTLTPYRVDAAAPELEVWIVRHDGGAASTWVAAAQTSDTVAMSGPGRGYAIAPDAPAFFLAGDETAIPAIAQLLPLLPSGTRVDVHLEVAHPDGRLDLPPHPDATVHWHDLPAGDPPGDALVDAVTRADIDPAARVWAAGEAAAVQRIRRNLFEDRGFGRAQTTVRGYWKHGRGGDAAED
jgi:NADPH-dependent ferric siderophore reductase